MVTTKVVDGAPKRLAGADLVLVAPGSLAERWDVAILAQTEGQSHRARAAALGLCWPRYRRRYPYAGNAVAYGGAVIDHLLAEGATIGEILVAGAEAYMVCLDGLVAVEGAEDFSETPEGGAPTGE